jgi:hypothetical protein
MVTSEMLATVTTAVSGSPLPSQARWILDPGLPRSTGFAPTWSPAFGAHTGRVHTRARPVQPARQTQPVQHLQVELLEQARLGPLVQPPPCRRRRPAAKFLDWQEPPRGRGAGHVDDRGETAAIWNRSPPAAIPGARCGRQQGCDHPPEFVGNKVLSKGRHDQKLRQSRPRERNDALAGFRVGRAGRTSAGRGAAAPTLG